MSRDHTGHDVVTDDEEEYLQPDFDPSLLRVADLRGILVAHEVPHASGLKKAQLVELFNEQVATPHRQRQQRLQQQQQQQRQQQQQQQQALPKVGRSSSAEVPTLPVTPKTVKKRSNSRRRTTLGLQDASGGEQDEPSLGARQRQDEQDTGAFSDVNSFQFSGSETPAARKTSHSRRRSSVGAKSIRSRRSTSGANYPDSAEADRGSNEAEDSDDFVSFKPQSISNVPLVPLVPSVPSVPSAERLAKEQQTPHKSVIQSTPAAATSSTMNFPTHQQIAALSGAYTTTTSTPMRFMNVPPIKRDHLTDTAAQTATTPSTSKTTRVSNMRQLSSDRLTGDQVQQLQQQHQQQQQQQQLQPRTVATAGRRASSETSSSLSSAVSPAHSTAISPVASRTARQTLIQQQQQQQQQQSPQQPLLYGQLDNDENIESPLLTQSHTNVRRRYRSQTTAKVATSASINDDLALEYGLNGSDGGSLFASLFKLAFVVFGAWIAFNVWSQRESHRIGFCDTGVIPSDTLADLDAPLKPFPWHTGYDEVDSFTDSAFGQAQQFIRENQPVCMACPAHATCNNSLQPRCEAGYTLESHPFDTPVYPLPPVCVTDDTLRLLAENLGKDVLRIASVYAGEKTCGGYMDEVNKKTNPDDKLEAEFVVSGLYLPTVRDELRKGKYERLPATQFDEAWRLAIRELKKPASMQNSGNNAAIVDIAELQMDPPGISGEYILSRVPDMSWSCRIHRAVVGAFVNNLRTIIVLFALGGLVYYISSRRKTQAAINLQVARLVRQVEERLIDQEHMHSVDPVQYPSNALATVHLRDELMRDEWNMARRERIWERVTRIVEANSNVRPSSTTVKGDIYRVWEWVGSMPALLTNTGRLSSVGSSTNIEQLSLPSPSTTAHPTAASGNLSGSGSGGGGHQRRQSTSLYPDLSQFGPSS
ncbi:hypothetical protein GQ42DRAFT_163282 [Ramicandelaber brevisporus]|nr:hypothetical protein GQ42DRAFT_163282 [Ramicandelaber brevisporus]